MFSKLLTFPRDKIFTSKFNGLDVICKIYHTKFSNLQKT